MSSNVLFELVDSMKCEIFSTFQLNSYVFFDIGSHMDWMDRDAVSPLRGPAQSQVLKALFCYQLGPQMEMSAVEPTKKQLSRHHMLKFCVIISWDLLNHFN